MRRVGTEESGRSPASLRLMMSELSRHPVLSAQEESELWRRYQVEHDRRAREALILANLRFVVMVARQYRARGVPMSDLIQEGNVGLVKAVQRFRADMGYRLTSYAVWWIRSQIQSYLLSSYSAVKLGTGRAQRKVFFCLARARRELRASSATCVDATGEDAPAIARKLGVEVEAVEAVLRRVEGRDLSISAGDLPAALGGEEAGDGAAEAGFAEGRDDDERLAALRAALARLSARDRRIVEARFLSAPPVKLRTLAADLGVTAARVNQLEIRALERLRAALRGAG